MLSCAVYEGRMDLNQKITRSFSALQQLVEGEPWLQAHLLSGIDTLHCNIMELKGRMHEKVHNPIDSLVPLDGSRDSMKRMKPLCEVILGKSSKKKKKHQLVIEILVQYLKRKRALVMNMFCFYCNVIFITILKLYIFVSIIVDLNSFFCSHSNWSIH